jgi:hypothetical protein
MTVTAKHITDTYCNLSLKCYPPVIVNKHQVISFVSSENVSYYTLRTKLLPKIFKHRDI